MNTLFKTLLPIISMVIAMSTLQGEAFAQLGNIISTPKEEESYLQRVEIKVWIFEAPDYWGEGIASSTNNDNLMWAGVTEIPLNISSKDQLHDDAQKRLYMGGEKELQWLLDEINKQEILGELRQISNPTLVTVMGLLARVDLGIEPILYPHAFERQNRTILLVELMLNWVDEKQEQWQMELSAVIGEQAEYGVPAQHLSVEPIIIEQQFILLQGLCRNSQLDIEATIFTSKCVPIYILVKPELAQ